MAMEESTTASRVPKLTVMPPMGVAPGAAPTPHKLSGRRLSKSVMAAAARDAEGSKGWGMVAVTDGSGTSRAIRVVQQAVKEDAWNMYKVSWIWTLDSKTYKVELRHGRRSGIRKIYVNKELVERQKSLASLVSDTGSTHMIQLGEEHDAAIHIVKSGGSFTYQLEIDGCPIEQSIAGPMSGGSLDLGDRTVVLPKTADGLGMTLRNNPNGSGTGVVVWTVFEGMAAERAGLRVGDVVLSVHDQLVDNIGPLADLIANTPGESISMELAGSLPSRLIKMQKDPNGDGKVLPIGIGVQSTSCGVGILISEIDTGSAAAASELKLGDCILSIDGAVPCSPKDAVLMVLGSPGKEVEFVVIGDALLGGGEE